MASSSNINTGNIVERTYSTTVQYKPGKFQYGKMEDVYFSASSPPLKKEQNQRIMLLRDKKLNEFQEETVLKKVIPGQDGRQRIQKTSEYPYSIHVQLEMKFSDGTYGGSGSLIGPHHVLTCGHNVYDIKTKKWATKITAYPGRNEKSAPYGKATVIKAYTFNNYTNNKERAYDIALLLLDRSVGKYTGWGGLCSAPDDSLKGATFNITGYPGDKGLDQMWSMSHKIKSIEKEIFEYEIDTNRGQSGSAIWVKDEFGSVKIMGVHTLGGFDKNSGVRISKDKFTKLFQTTIANTYKIQKSQQSNLTPSSSSSSSSQNSSDAFINQFSDLSISSNPSNSQSTRLPSIALGKTVWQKHFGLDSIQDPQQLLPCNINAILNKPTPFKVEGYTGKVIDTHFLVWIPKKVSGIPLSLDNLEKIFGNYKYYDSDIKKSLGAKTVSSSHWVLLSKGILEATRNKTSSDQNKIIRKYDFRSYNLPNVLDVAIAVLLYQKEKPGDYLLPEKPKLTYTRCIEKVYYNHWPVSNERPVAIGCFGAGGLNVSNSYDVGGNSCGFIGAWKL
ncbi:trypsin-like serine peptidase [Candidatus Neptunochlamydia vexilliferae]|nr:trypsin-like serine protease [Candidatus Neptunochlamydia vexilliferae]